MHGRLRVSSRVIYASCASLGTVVGLIIVFYTRGLAGAANLAQLISLIPIFGIFFGWTRRRKEPSEPSAGNDDSSHAESTAAGHEEPAGEGTVPGQAQPVPPRHHTDLRRRLDDRLVLPVALAMCAVLAVAIPLIAHFGFSGSSGAPVQPKSHPLPAALTVQPNLELTYANYCKWRFGTHPMPLAAVNPPAFFIDNRCVVPVDADPSDPTKDGLTKIRSGADHNDPLVTSLRAGDKVIGLCWTFGQDIGITLGINPPVYPQSNLWLKVRAPDGKVGYLADVYIGGGGYSQRQLTGLGLKQCG